MLYKTINCFQAKTIAFFLKFSLLFFTLFAVLTLKAQRNYATASVLSTGNWYKIGVIKGGVNKIDVNFLKNLGVNTANLPSANIRLYGNGGQMIPENNATPRIDDLFENAIWVNDGGDGVFNNNDYFLFYAAGTKQRVFDTVTSQQFNYVNNLYRDTAYYFLTIQPAGKRVLTQPSGFNPTVQVNSYMEHVAFQPDSVNLLNSGKLWWSNPLNQSAGLTRTFTVNTPGILNGVPITVNYYLAANNVGTNSNFSLALNGNLFATPAVNAVSGYFLDAYANTVQQQGTVVLTGLDSVLKLSLSLNPGVSGAQGWYQKIVLQFRPQLAMYANNPYL
jgi:hypothetical protein